MDTGNSSFSPANPDVERQEEPKRQPVEIDRFVDHFLSLMCDRSRRQILELLTTPPEEGTTEPIEKRSTDIARALGLSPATTSGHLKQLAEAKLIASRREGNEVYYRLYNHLLVKAFQDLIQALNQEHSSRLLEMHG